MKIMLLNKQITIKASEEPLFLKRMKLQSLYYIIIDINLYICC